jgi:hypothetical protein
MTGRSPSKDWRSSERPMGQGEETPLGHADGLEHGLGERGRAEGAGLLAALVLIQLN